MRATGKIHAAKLESSPRLQRVLSFLRVRGAQGATTREIVQHADVCAVNSICDELRVNGFKITGEWVEVPGGGRAFRYRLDQPQSPPVQGDLFKT